ncbi:c-type cytochrome [Merismopedia glauca]|uniref:c-type cytochrome n=1 Tax=Merismopedia glauca TaxID=292586 RepID=UPI002481C660|nr:cytochrome c [Merismopedia glauca]
MTAITIQRLVLLALTLLLAFSFSSVAADWVRGADPYVKNVLSTTGDPMQGHAIFQMNCAGCHGWKGEGKVGPSLCSVSKRKSRIRLIEQVISGKTPPMPQFKPSPQEMADLLSYLEGL